MHFTRVAVQERENWLALLQEQGQLGQNQFSQFSELTHSIYAWSEPTGQFWQMVSALRKYLRFIWRGEMFQFTALPISLSSCPRISTKVHKPVFATLRCQFGYSCLGCIDDSFYTKDTLHRCQEATLHAVQLFIQLEFVVHPTKSAFQPTQSLEFLGSVLDSILMRVAMTKVKVDNIYGLVPLFSHQQLVHYSPRSLLYRNSCVHFSQGWTGASVYVWYGTRT